MDRFGERPVKTGRYFGATPAKKFTQFTADLSIDWGKVHLTDMYPQVLCDLIVGRPVVVTGRFTGEPSTVTVGGRTGMQPISYTVKVDSRETNKEHKGIAAVWARLKIA